MTSILGGGKEVRQFWTSNKKNFIFHEKKQRKIEGKLQCPMTKTAHRHCMLMTQDSKLKAPAKECVTVSEVRVNLVLAGVIFECVRTKTRRNSFKFGSLQKPYNCFFVECLKILLLQNFFFQTYPRRN